MTESTEIREKHILDLAIHLITNLSDASKIDEASIDAEFLFNFDQIWCIWVLKIRKMMRGLLKLDGDNPLLTEDGARFLLHLDANKNLSVGIELDGKNSVYTIENSKDPYHILDEELREQHDKLAENYVELIENPDQHREKFDRLWQKMWMEANQTSKIQDELSRMARSYNLIPSNHQINNFTPNQVKKQNDSIRNWVIYGHSTPAFLNEKTILVESKIDSEDKCTIRPWEWSSEEPFSQKRLPLKTRIRTWAIYYLTKCGGGELETHRAIERWNKKFPSHGVESEFYKADLERILEWGSGKGLRPSLSDLFESVRKRWAVIVGINKYDDQMIGDLHVCVKDAEGIYKILISSGFDQKFVSILSDSSIQEPTRIEILKTLKVVAEATEPEDLLLFYFSGHGGEIDSESYLLSRDANTSILSDSAVPISRVKEIMEEAPAQAKAIILDACHSGAKIDGKGASVMSASFIRNVFEESEGIAILASCKQGELSYEWKDEGRSVFTRILLDALSGKADRDNKGFVTVQDANRHVVDGVKEWAVRNGVSQNPTSQTSMVGDIPLVRY